MARIDGRRANEIRPIKVRKGYLKYAPGSCLIEWGNTKILCTATLEYKVPQFLRNTQKGWLTAEYSMLPASSQTRIVREGAKGKISGRTHEIQRLVGRSLRSIVDLTALGERTIWIDCDVLQADGGTRTASITGAFIALGHLVEKLSKKKLIEATIIKDFIAAISVGVIKKRVLIDLCYDEDSQAEVDMNVVMTGNGKIVEIQGTAEGSPFGQAELDKMLGIARKGINQLITLQKKYVKI